MNLAQVKQLVDTGKPIYVQFDGGELELLKPIHFVYVSSILKGTQAANKELYEENKALTKELRRAYTIAIVAAVIGLIQLLH
jgi:hypothetical protein